VQRPIGLVAKRRMLAESLPLAFAASMQASSASPPQSVVALVLGWGFGFSRKSRAWFGVGGAESAPP